MIEFLTLLGGLVLLYLGAEGLVRGGKQLAIALGVHPMVVGLTVIAAGTSLPELVVSTTAAIRGSSSIAIGNVLGSNVFNMSVIIGVASIIFPLHVQDRTIRLEVPAVIFSGIALYVFCGNLDLNPFEGIILIVAYLGFIFIGILPQIIKRFRVLPKEIIMDFDNPVSEDDIAEARAKKSWITDILLITLGLAGLVYGARQTVESAIEIARILRVSELVIGSTIIAAGTSLPELATSIVAALKNEPDISIGNAVGSNFFNALIVTGIPAVVAGPLTIEKGVLMYDFPIMIAVSFLVLPLLRSGGKVDRTEGFGLLAVYVGYILLITIRPQFMFPVPGF